MRRSTQEIRQILCTFRKPDRAQYPELDGYSDDDCYRELFGGGGLYLAAHMLRTLRIQPRDMVLDLGCGEGTTSIYLAKHYDARVVALDLWTSKQVLNQKFKSFGYADQITAVQMDAADPLPFPENFFDNIFCMNSFNFYGGSLPVLEQIVKHLKPGGRICIGSEVLSAEFTPEQMENPPQVYAFRLPAPNEHVDVFHDDFAKQHTTRWWCDLFESSRFLDVECCYELKDADVLYEELVRYEYDNNIDPFDVQICLDQIEWGKTHQPKKSLFVLTARRR